MSYIVVNGLTKRFGDVVAVDNVSLEIFEGEFLTLLGPSGCGKTTTLRCIAGLEFPDDGFIKIGPTVVFDKDKKIARPPEERNISMVFQTYALWPHMTVFDNIAFGLRRKRVPRDRIEAAVTRALEMVQLSHTRNRLISQLSGGQQQRIALARSIAFEANVILFDEPLSNLDAKLREEMRLEIRELQKELGFTAIYVTHDQEEAMSLSDRIVIMNAGRVEQVDHPRNVYFAPANSFVASFIGSNSRFDGVVTGLGPAGTMVVSVEGFGELLVAGGQDMAVGQPVQIFVRHEDIELVLDDHAGPEENVWPARVLLESFLGSTSLVKVQIGAVELMLSVRQPFEIAEDAAVLVHIPPQRIFIFPREDEAGELQPSTQLSIEERGTA